MSEQLSETGTIVLANSQPQIGDGQEHPISTSQRPASIRRFKVYRSIVPVDESESSDLTITRRFLDIIRPIEGMEPSIANRALEENINHYPIQQFEIEQVISEGQENLVGDVITAEDGSILSFKEIKEQHNLLPGQVEPNSGLVPLTSLENQERKTVRVVDVGIISAKKLPMLNNTELKKAA